MAATAHSAVAMMSASSGMMYVVIESLDPAVAEAIALSRPQIICAYPQVRGMITLCATKTSIAIHRKNKMVMPIQSPSNRVARCDHGSVEWRRRSPD